MRVTVEKETIQIVFIKEHAEHRNGKEKLNTHCHLYRVFPNKPNQDKIYIGLGSAYLNYKDTYDKVKGKKIALANALQMCCWAFLTKKHRTIIWDRFKIAFNISKPEVDFR